MPIHQKQDDSSSSEFMPDLISKKKKPQNNSHSTVNKVESSIKTKWIQNIEDCNEDINSMYLLNSMEKPKGNSVELINIFIMNFHK